MKFTDKQWDTINNIISSIAKRHDKEISLWHFHDDNVELTIKVDRKILLKEKRDDFTFDEYIHFINKLESCIMPKCH